MHSSIVVFSYYVVDSNSRPTCVDCVDVWSEVESQDPAGLQTRMWYSLLPDMFILSWLRRAYQYKSLTC